MTKVRKYKKAYASELLNIAKNDLVAAVTLSKDPKVRRETVLFQVQQSIEKGLKAVLCANEKPVPIVHDLAIILDRLDVPPPHASSLTDLSDFASIRRYEEGKFQITDDEIKATLAAAKEVMAFCENELKKANI